MDGTIYQLCEEMATSEEMKMDGGDPGPSGFNIDLRMTYNLMAGSKSPALDGAS